MSRQTLLFRTPTRSQTQQATGDNLARGTGAQHGARAAVDTIEVRLVRASDFGHVGRHAQVDQLMCLRRGRRTVGSGQPGVAAFSGCALEHQRTGNQTPTMAMTSDRAKNAGLATGEAGPLLQARQTDEGLDVRVVPTDYVAPPVIRRGPVSSGPTAGEDPCPQTGGTKQTDRHFLVVVPSTANLPSRRSEEQKNQSDHRDQDPQ